MEPGERVQVWYREQWYEGTFCGAADEETSGQGYRWAAQCDADKRGVLTYTTKVRAQRGRRAALGMGEAPSCSASGRAARRGAGEKRAAEARHEAANEGPERADASKRQRDTHEAPSCSASGRAARRAAGEKRAAEAQQGAGSEGPERADANKRRRSERRDRAKREREDELDSDDSERKKIARYEEMIGAGELMRDTG
jgi:hypothetical protein